MKDSGYLEKIHTARDDLYKYLFLHSFSENLEKHKSLAKVDLLDSKPEVPEVVTNTFTDDGTKIDSKKPEKSFLRKLFD
jgi:hypothetical protein